MKSLTMLLVHVFMSMASYYDKIQIQHLKQILLHQFYKYVYVNGTTQCCYRLVPLSAATG